VLRFGVAVVAVMSLIGACATELTSVPGVFLPSATRTAGGGLAASAEGVLEIKDGCLWLEQEGGRYLPIWPRGTSLHDSSTGLILVTADRATTVIVGTNRVALGGGEAPSRASVEGSIGQTIPDQCATAPFWSVFTIEVTN
jgi:hypothetical protein